MKKITYTLLLLLGITTTIFTQNITSTFRGTVKDSKNQQPLTGATVHIFSNQFSAGEVTDSLGNFKITDVNIGRFEVEVNFLGYNTLVLSEVLIEAGKEQVMDIVLEESFADLQEIVVKANSSDNTLSPISNHLITIEEVERFPATFFDPARLAMLYPGVTGTNDQANGLSIRGLPASLLQWRLEGVEIVNPNHLSNAGTISDQPSVAAGGVNILSAQMLDNSRLYTGAFPVEYSNALGGVMDMRLRKGNNQQHEFTAQAGLLGFDLGMEGPFSKKNKASFLFNYRYSFTGLLTNFGVDFDGEEIGFEDVSFNLNLPTKRAGNFMVFGIGGRSDNFKAALPEEEWEEINDTRTIDFISKTGVIGASHKLALSNKTLWKTTLAYSIAKNDYEIVFSEDSKSNILYDSRKISGQTQIQSSLSSFIKVKAGIQVEHNFVQDSLDGGSIENHKTNWISFSPFANFQFSLGDKIKIDVGGNFNISDINRNLLFFSFPPFLEPENDEKTGRISKLDLRGTVNWKISNKNQLSLYVGQHSDMMGLENYQEIRESRTSNFHFFQFSRAFQQSLNYQNTSIPKTRLTVEIYHQIINNVPVTNRSKVLTNIDEDNFFFNDRKISNFNGVSRNIGVELMVQRTFSKNWYFLVSGTLYDSQFKKSDEDYEIARFNGNWVANITVGKEFVKQKLDKTNVFGIHLRGLHRGGFWEQRIDNDYYSGINFSDSFNEQLSAYFRIDARFYLKWNKANRTTSLSLDLQNATNHQNAAYTYVDFFGPDEIKTQYQLGLIPLLNYRIEF